MIHVPASSATGGIEPEAAIFADVLERLIGAGLPDEEIVRALDIDPWSVALLRSFLMALDAAQASAGFGPGA